MEQNNINTPRPLDLEPSNSFLQKIKKTIGIKTAIIIFCILLVIGLIYFFRSVFVAASVNGDVISRLEVINRLEKNGGGQMLDSLITESLIKGEAKKKGIVVTDEEMNTEMVKLETQFTGQGTTLDAALEASGLTRDNLKEQILIQKQLEKLLGSSTEVTDAEVTKYITDNKITITKSKEIPTRVQIKEQLVAEKMSLQVDALLTNLKGQAKIKYYVQY